MKTATLDLLDRTLSDEFIVNINAAPEHRFAFYKETLVLDPTYWEQYFCELSKYTFAWEEFKYEWIAKQNSSLTDFIAKERTGVYLFIVKSNNLINDMPKQVLYVGIAGESSSNRSLLERLNDYFYIEQIKKRRRIHMLLKKYYKNVYVAFSYVDIPYHELRQLEENLHGFFYPIYCERDFPAQLKEKRKAFPI